MDNLATEQEYISEAEYVPPPQGAFTKLKGVSTAAATSSEDQLKNVRENLKLNLPLLHNMPEFNKVKGKDKKIALVGGGPSLKDHLEELKTFKTIISCGSVHDFLIENNIIPTYAANCDPSHISAYYFKKSDTEVRYLMASNVDKAVLDMLKGKQIILWHCHSLEQQDEFIKIEKEYNRDYQGIGGGCTVGLRSISIALCLGYSNLHFFGFDSCMGDMEATKHHAYDWVSPEEEKSCVEKVYRIKVGPETGPEGNDYFVAGYQLAQMENFKDFYCAHKELFTPTFHGTGALPAYAELIKKDLLEQVKEKTNV